LNRKIRGQCLQNVDHGNRIHSSGDGHKNRVARRQHPVIGNRLRDLCQNLLFSIFFILSHWLKIPEIVYTRQISKTRIEEYLNERPQVNRLGVSNDELRMTDYGIPSIYIGNILTARTTEPVLASPNP
jgi:hypothetical protein